MSHKESLKRKFTVYISTRGNSVVFALLQLISHRHVDSGRFSAVTLAIVAYSYQITCYLWVAGCERAVTVFAFWPTLTYFCDGDTQLYDRSTIIHISKAITTTVKSPTKLVAYTLRRCKLASSPTNLTLTL